MDLVCHENLNLIDTTTDHHHHSRHHHYHSHILHVHHHEKQRQHKLYQQDDDYMSSSNSNSSSYSLSPPPSLSQYSTTSTMSMSSGIGSSTCQSPPTSAGHFGSLVEDSNFGHSSEESSSSLSSSATSSTSSSFANFRNTVQRDHRHHTTPVAIAVAPAMNTNERREEELVAAAETLATATATIMDQRRSTAIVVEEGPAANVCVVERSRPMKRVSSAQPQVIHYHHSPKIRKADRDPVFLENRCLANLFELEQQLYHTTRGNMKGDINDQMRRIVAAWMMELCEGRACQEEVCLLALNYMDRYLIVCEVKKNHLQLLAAACLLLASKLREPSCTSLTADILVYFTDNSITKIDLIQWELLVLSALKWDISVVTPLDFLEHFLSRLAIRDLDVNKVRLHAQAFICLAAQEHFMEASSTIAAASLAVSINGLHCRESGDDAGLLIVNRLVDKSVSMGRLLMDSLIVCMNRMESIYEEQKSKLVPEYILNTPPNSPVNVKDGGQVVPATPQKCPPKRCGDGSESEGDIKF